MSGERSDNADDKEEQKSKVRLYDKIASGYNEKAGES